MSDGKNKTLLAQLSNDVEQLKKKQIELETTINSILIANTDLKVNKPQLSRDYQETETETVDKVHSFTENELLQKFVTSFSNVNTSVVLNSELLKMVNIIDTGFPNSCFLNYFSGLYWKRANNVERAKESFYKSIKLDSNFAGSVVELSDIEQSFENVEPYLNSLFNRPTTSPGKKILEFQLETQLRIASQLGKGYSEQQQRPEKAKKIYKIALEHLNTQFKKSAGKFSEPEWQCWKNMCFNYACLLVNNSPEKACEWYKKGLALSYPLKNNPALFIPGSVPNTIQHLDKQLLQGLYLTSSFIRFPSSNAIINPNIHFDVWRNDFEVLITGPGSAGNTEFIKAFKKAGIRVNDCHNHDTFKHAATVPDLKNVKKAIYIYGEPSHSIFSLYRRYKDTSSGPNKHFHQFPGNYIHSKYYGKYINDVVSSNEDLSGIEQQLENWSQGSEHFPILFIDFSNYDPNILCRFLGKDINLPKFNAIQFKKHDNEKTTNENIDYKKIYINLYNRMKSMNNKIVPKKTVSIKTLNDKIRIGYMSPDFNKNAVGLFLTPLLKHFDKERFEIYCYDMSKGRDMYSDIFYGFDELNWFSIDENTGMNPFQIYNLIKSHNLDILVDLIGYGHHYKMEVLAMKPAPIIINYLGYPGVTNLNETDYRIVDYVTDPKFDSLNEKPLYLESRCFVCYSLFENTPIPKIKCYKREPGNNKLRIGIMNKSSKMMGNNILINIWKHILAKNKNLELWVKLDESKKDEHRLVYKNNFPSKQIKFFDFCEKLPDYFELYNQVDFCIDTFPYSGTTTTCSALLMGVPTFTVYNPNNLHVSNVTGSILKHCGEELSPFLCSSLKDYRDSIVKFKPTFDREVIRDQFLKTMDPKLFMKEYESALLSIL
jgi:predicted O-linked N-acetylglucosamine transferase (SPINDLY family)